MTAARTVKVFCRVANGVELRLFGPGYDDGTGSGYKPILPQGPRVILKGPSAIHAGPNNPALHNSAEPTEVDAEWWAKWVEQNKGRNPLFDRGFIWAEET